MGRAKEARTRTHSPFPSIDRGVSDSLAPRVSVNHGMTIMPLDNKIAMFVYKLEVASHERVQEGLSYPDSGCLKLGPDSSRGP
ncbi:hypothetical protein CRG98_042983 [Punica granatum]|uniref:Uncharacterized protein n=1 Tax=Punica granatum TaxID=22663 RepID=A0A2I0HYL5_PUNGR|nr:hypothetical protein CRG98_042983 [Punica granatum]